MASDDEFFNLEHSQASMASESRIAAENAAAKRKARMTPEETDIGERINALFNDRRSA